MTAFNETSEIWWNWVRAYGMPSYGAAQPDQHRWRRFVGGPMDGDLRKLHGPPVVRAAYPQKFEWPKPGEPIPTEVSVTTTNYHERKVQPCWSAHYVRLMVWEVLLDVAAGGLDDYALDQIMVGVFGTAAQK